MSFWCRDSLLYGLHGLHTVAVQVNDDGKYKVYNRFNSDDKHKFEEREYNSIKEILINGDNHGKYICGYYLPQTMG